MESPMQENILHQIENIASRSKTNDIFVLGKGPSLDEMNGFTLPDSVIINLNDSERIHPGQICIFSANWVRHSLAESGFRCEFYLSGKPLTSDVNHEVLPPLPLELDQEELSVFRLERPEFYDESLVLLNALKVALLIAQLKNCPQNVYLLGLDFSTQKGSLSRRISQDFSNSALGDREAIVHAQEYEYRQFAGYFQSKEQLRLIHVGHREFSTLSPAAFLRQIRSTSVGPQRLSSSRFKSPNHVLVVAELTNNHLGDPRRLVEMVELAKASGADLIKVQKRDVDTFYTKEQLESYYWSPFGTTLGDYRRGVELTDDLLDLLDETCRRCEIEWFCSVLDYPSYSALERFKPQLLKIPSTISNHRDFHSKLAQSYYGDIVVSTGFTSADYLDYVLETFESNEHIYLLHCVSAYPTPLDACNIAVVRSYSELAKRNPKIIPGYSSHDLGSLGCMLAVASGARMVEKHVKLGDVDWVHFDKVAIDLSGGEFDEFVNSIRSCESIMGQAEKKVLECEHHKYSVQKS
jgi:sialic acid synthase SpsE